MLPSRIALRRVKNLRVTGFESVQMELHETCSSALGAQTLSLISSNRSYVSVTEG